MLTPLEVAYLAGLFDGEGSVSFIWPKASKNGKRYGRLVAKIAQKDPTVLYWVQEVMGFGGVQGKADDRGGYCYYVTAANARKFLEYVRPYVRIKGEAIDQKRLLDAECVVARKTIASRPTGRGRSPVKRDVAGSNPVLAAQRPVAE